jgi:hypothetical protein
MNAPREKRILRPIQPPARGEPAAHADFLFFCPGCKCCHGVWTTKANSRKALWEFNGNLEKPTFSPSLLIRFTKDPTPEEQIRILSGEPFQPKQLVCHLFVRDGMLEFLTDCTHELAGKTVPMEPF